MPWLPPASAASLIVLVMGNKFSAASFISVRSSWYTGATSVLRRCPRSESAAIWRIFPLRSVCVVNESVRVPTHVRTGAYTVSRNNHRRQQRACDRKRVPCAVASVALLRILLELVLLRGVCAPSGRRLAMPQRPLSALTAGDQVNPVACCRHNRTPTASSVRAISSLQKYKGKKY